MAPLGSAACKGALLLAIVVTAGLGHLDSHGCFQPQPTSVFPSLAPGLETAPTVSLGKRTFSLRIPATGPGQETLKGVPCSCSGENTCCRKALCIRLHDKCI